MVRADEITGFVLTGGLTDAQRGEVASCGTAVSFGAGNEIFAEGAPADACWLIRTGRVALVSEALGNSAVLQTLATGDVLGWSWLVPPHRTRFGAVTTERVEAFRLDGACLRGLMDRDPVLGSTLALAMVQVVAERLTNTRARLLDLYGNPRDR